MKNIQEVFNEIKDLNKEKKDINKEYRDALINNSEYEEVKEKLEELKIHKQQIETMVQEEMGTRCERLEKIKDEMKELKQMQSDVAMSELMEGKTIEVKDEFDNIYEPIFSVNFKKTNAKAVVEQEKEL